MRPIIEGDFTERFEYDSLGREILHVSFEGTVTESVYDDSAGAGGRLSEQKFFDNLTAYDNGNGTPSQVTVYDHDAFGRQFEVVQDADGNLNTTSDERITETVYNGEGQIVSITSPEGIVNYEYDPVTGLQTRTYTGTINSPIDDTRYNFDALGRLSTVEVYERNGVMVDVDPNTDGNQPEVTHYDYDLIGNLARERKPNGNVVDYVYDSLNRLTEQTEFTDANGNGVYDSGTDAMVSKFDYSLLPDGKRSGAIEKFWFDDNSDGIAEEHDNTVSWTYDNIGRLTDEVFDHYDNNFDQTEHYVYDLVGNRLQETLDKGNDSTIDETTDSVYDANDRLLSESVDTDGQPGYEKVTTYGYDHTQQTLQEVTEGGVLQSKTEYTYDLQGRMETAKVTTYTSGVASSIVRTTYGYDASGIRVSALTETDSNADGTYETAVKTEYLNDPQNQTGYSQVLAETTTDLGTQQVQKRVIYAIGHTLISQTTVNYSNGQPQSAQTVFFGRDGHNNTRFLEATTGAVIPDQVYSYDSFGVALGFDPAAALTVHLYCGEQYDPTGLDYFRNRYYMPASGTFTTLDPIFGDTLDPQSFHKYVYCHGDGINGIDPLGRDLIETIDAVVTSIGIEAWGIGQALMPALYHVTVVAAGICAASSLYSLVSQAGFLPVNPYSDTIAIVSGIVATAGASAYTALEVSSGRTALLPTSDRVRVFRVEGDVNQRIWIGEDGTVAIEGKKCLFVNFGDKQRAIDYFQQKVGQNMECVAERSFEVPKSVLDDIRAIAVPQDMGALYPNSPQIVDVTKALDQYGLKENQIDTLRKAVIQGTGEEVW